MNPEDLIKKYGMGKKVDASDEGIFFKILKNFFRLKDIEELWHIVTMKNTKCLIKIFTKVDILLLTAAVAYVVFPLDAIPDFIPFSGWLDDATVINFILNRLGNKISEYRNKCM